jgi:dTDP-4-amino-4,6-dideoxygalactose transaminase
LLRHGKLILGPEVAEFEKRIAEYTGADHAVGVNSGTDALLLALKAHGIGPGHEVITVAHSFLATASAICLAGAVPVFCDIDPETMLMDPKGLEELRTERTRAVMPVHLNGFPCDMDAIAGFCQKHGLALIEDCAQAIGARYHDRHVGTFGEGCFSLHPLKILSACGDAGMILTSSDPEIYRRRRNLGLEARGLCTEVAGNSRLDSIQAAILLVKMKYMEDWMGAREANAQVYRDALKGLVRMPPEPGPHRPVYSHFVIRHPRRDALWDYLQERGIRAKVHYPVPIHQQPAFRRFAKHPLPVTEKTAGEILSLPVTPELQPEDRDRVIEAVRGFCGA